MKPYAMFRRAIILIMLSIMPVIAHASDRELFQLKTAWMGESEAFPVWLAIQKGWDKEQGLDVSMLHFSSGKEIVDGLLAYDWMIAGCGAVPAISAVLSDRISIVAVATDEAMANEIVARENNPVFAVKDNGQLQPAGEEILKNSVALLPKGTSAHYLLLEWLKTIGVSPDTVKIKDMSPHKALGAFVGGMGDVGAVWAPQTFLAHKAGLKTVTTAGKLGIKLPIVIAAGNKFASEHPKTLEAFLKMYFRTTELIKNGPCENFAGDYQKFMKEWASIDISPEQAKEDLRNHPFFTLAENMKMFTHEKGESEIARIMARIASMLQQGAKDQENSFKPAAITDLYIKAISGEL